MNRYSKALRILSPKGQIEDKSLLAVKIVKGEHYSRPVMEKEQEYIKQTFKKSNQYRYREDNWLENLIKSKETEFDQKESADLDEGMTTSGLLQITLPEMGDVDLENVTQTATPGTEGAGGSDGSYSFGNYDAYGAAGFTLRLDTRKYDTLTFNATGGNATKIEYTINGPPFRTLSSGTNSITISAADRGSSTEFLFNARKSLFNNLVMIPMGVIIK